MDKIDLSRIQKEKPIEELINFSIINLDKPAEHTSFEVVARVREIFKLEKAGHFGTLDSGVTGVLPIALGKACRLSNFFMHHDKEYMGSMNVHKHIDINKLRNEMMNFQGKIKQLPPQRSNVKRQIRQRTINRFELLKLNGRIAEFHADVEAGTYIRKLVYDLGERIGGAHMIYLRRIRAGIFNEKDSSKIEQIEKAALQWKEKVNEKELRKLLIPAEIITRIFPTVYVKGEFEEKFKNGSPLFKEMLLDGKELEKFETINNDERIVLFIEEKFLEVAKVSKKGNRLAMPEFVLN